MKKGVQRVMHCPCGQGKILAQGLCATCYTMKRQDEEYFGGLRSLGSRQTLDHCAPSRARQISSPSDDLALPGLPCQGASNEDGADGAAALASGAVARTAPRQSGATRSEFYSAETGRSSDAAGIYGRRVGLRSRHPWNEIPEYSCGHEALIGSLLWTKPQVCVTLVAAGPQVSICHVIIHTSAPHA